MLPGGVPCEIAAEDIEAARAAARADVDALIARRRDERAAFDARPGWRVTVIAADAAPLWPMGFDPLNVEIVAGGVLHTRFLKLGNDGGEIEVVDGPDADVVALTQAAGKHPLFNGIRRVTVAGLTAEPEIVDAGSDGEVALRARGMTLRLRNATIARGDREVTLRVGAPRP